VHDRGRPGKFVARICEDQSAFRKGMHVAWQRKAETRKEAFEKGRVARMSGESVLVMEHGESLVDTKEMNKF